MALIAKDKEIVVPGECLAEGMDYLPGYGTYREEQKIICSRLGMINIEGRAVKIIPLSGKYLPKRGDTIIAVIEEILFSGWRVDTNSAYSAVLNISEASSEYIPKGADLKRFHTFGDYIVCKITNVTSQKLVDITMKGPGLRKLRGGRIITVNTHKVPRIIGKKGSMISMVKQATDCRIIVGQNGVVWIHREEPNPEMEFLAVDAIKMIEEQSHISGLTNKIKDYLEKQTGKKIEMRAEGE